jgi:hypothetical protein
MGVAFIAILFYLNSKAQEIGTNICSDFLCLGPMVDGAVPKCVLPVHKLDIYSGARKKSTPRVNSFIVSVLQFFIKLFELIDF